MRIVTGYVSQADFGTTGLESPSFDFDGAIRIGSVVVEAEGTFTTGSVKGFAETYFDEYAFYRRGTRLVYDLPEDALRIRIGDVAPDFSGFQTSPDLFGVSIEKNYSALQPGKSIRPTGQRSFRIERPSNVDILIDGVVVRRIKLTPGNYNVADLPLQPGANNITLNIEEETGARQTLEFTAFSAQDLLAVGISEWAFAGGIKSFDRGVRDEGAGRRAYGQPDYEFDRPVATGYYRAGLLPALTAEVNGQVDDSVAVFGGGFLTQTPWGLFTLDGAASFDYEETVGAAAQFGYSYDKFTLHSDYTSSLRLLAEYQSPAFATVGNIEPVRDYSTILSANYSQQLPFSMAAGASFSYYVSRDENFADRWSADLTLSKQFTTSLSGSFAVGYGQDEAADNPDCCEFDEDGFRTFVRLSWTPDYRSNVVVSHDTRSETSRATYSRSSERSGVGAWNATVEAAQENENDSLVYGSLSSTGNRAEVSLSHSARVEGTSLKGAFDPQSTEQRSSLRVASSLVYADGVFGWGRPVSSGFAIVKPHASLDGRPVLVGSQDSVIARSGVFGPAVVPQLGTYSQTRLPYDVPDMPVGYDLGRASYDILAPYKAGYRLEAGSAYTVTAIGTLLNSHGEPIPLLGGTAREADKPAGSTVELFTNRAGRFGAQGLAPGRWVLEMPVATGPLRFEIVVPEGATGFFDAGDVRPAQS
jgi:outer membrane usher protein